MSRQPQQVHIFLYRNKAQDIYEFSIFQRADNEQWWQGICGGAEENETLEESARREIYEEAGISDILPLYPLETISYLPVSIFNKQDQSNWGEEMVVVPMYFFAMLYDGDITLSHEHKQVKWLTFEQADKLVYFHDQKTALWELIERLKRKLLIH